mgnify:CR=1 FL=1
MNVHIQRQLSKNHDIINEYNKLYKSDPIVATVQLGFEMMVAYEYNRLLHRFDHVPDDQTRSHAKYLLKCVQQQLLESAANPSFRSGSLSDKADQAKLAGKARFCLFLKNVLLDEDEA